SGKYDKKDAPGEISHFQALTVALSGTIGMGNIAGVAIAISMGGAGAIFWMWVAGLFGMIIKFFTCTLACLYRKQDE
ncbi:MAG: alanine:cation symporter family protein, partial [Gammaproteobacteria bacterium]